MKKFWTATSIIAILAVGGWIYRDHIPYLDKVPVLSGYVHKSGTQTADASTQAPGQDAGKSGGQASGGQAGGGQAAGQGGSGKGGGKRNGGPASVKTIAAAMGNLPMDATATGWAEAEDTTTLAALQSGLLQDVIAKDGQEVKAGDLIARLDDRIAQATVDKDKANIVADEASLVEYDAAFQRAVSLVKQNAQSQQTYEQAKAARDSAAAKVDADKATLASDLVDLEHMKIRAPFDGRLGSIQLSIGAYVSAGSAIVSITRYNPIYVRFQMPERYLPQLHQAFGVKDVAVDVDPASTGGVPVSGKLSFFDNTVDTASGTILVKAEFANDKGVLWPGQSANVTVRFPGDTETVLVPTVAVRPGADGFFVYTVNGDSKVKATKVAVLRANGDMTAISSGLKEGDHIVVEGQVQLADGQTVVEQFSGQKVAENEPKDVTR